MYNVENLHKTKENCNKFWEKQFIGRPFVCVTAPKEGVQRPQGLDFSYVKRHREVKSGDLDSMLKDFESLVKATYYGGEAMPVYTSDFSPDQYAAFFGGEIVGQEGQFTTWVHNIASEASALNCNFDSNNIHFQTLIRYIEHAAKFADGNFLIAMLDLHGNLDALSALLNPQNLCYELFDSP